jgi:hypothetical protein
MCYARWAAAAAGTAAVHLSSVHVLSLFEHKHAACASCWQHAMRQCLSVLCFNVHDAAAALIVITVDYAVCA